MDLKDNVIPNGLKPEALLGMMICNEVYKSFGRTLTITSICDGKHSTQSLHYTGYAFDCRTRTLTEDEKLEIADEIRSRLVRDYDVILEDTHIHVEYQPKRP